MTTTYREVRLGDFEYALAFAKEHGSGADPAQVRHQLSLGVRLDGETAGYALSIETQPGLFRVELALTDAAVGLGVGRPLADAVLRKLSAAGVDTARVQFLNDGETDRLWQETNWLDRVPSSDPPTESDNETGEADEPDTGAGDDTSDAPDSSAQAA